MSLIDLIRSDEDSISGKGCDVTYITAVEEELEIIFSDEYREYLKNMAIAAYDGHELTGITKSSRVNVLDVTKKYKLLNEHISKDMYVVEETNFDGIIIWQDKDGYIYQTQNNSKPVKICDSLEEFLRK